MNPFELTKQLMSITSVTGAEGEVGEFLSSYLANAGFRIERQEVAPARFNVLAFAGEPRVVLCSHIDTVPPSCPYGKTMIFCMVVAPAIPKELLPRCSRPENVFSVAVFAISAIYL